MLIPLYDTNPLKRWPVVTIAIILANALCYLYVANLPSDERMVLYIEHGFVPARIAQLQDPKLVVKVSPDEDLPELDVGFGPVVKKVEVVLQPNPVEVVLSLLSCMFLHGSVAHLLGNMWFLWIFGNNIEDRLGHVIYLGFYFVGGVFASMCHWFMIDAGADAATLPVVGASGAVAVMLGAYAVTYPTAKVKTLIFVLLIFVVDLPAMVVLGFWIFAQVSEAWGAFQLGIDGGVAWWAHIGGFVAGMLVMPLLAAGTPEPDEDWDKEAREQFIHEPPRREPPAW